MKGASFWPSVFFGNDVDPQYVHHTIVPTAFATQMASWKTILELANTEHPRWKEIQRQNVSCCFCGIELFEQYAIVAVRAVLEKRPCIKIPGTTLIRVPKDPPLTLTSFYYRWAFGSACICEKCAKTRNLRLAFDSDIKMQEEMFERLERMGAQVALDNGCVDVAPEVILQRVLETFDCEEHRVNFMRSLGKIDNPACMNCKNPSRRRCSGCHFARYCGKTCSIADWKLHKLECKLIAACPIFYGGKKNVSLPVKKQ